MITFEKQPIGTLDVEKGMVEGVQSKPNPLPDVGIPTEELHRQAVDLVNKKVPIEKALQAVDSHSDITDKPRAKSMISAVYQIMGKAEK